MLKSCNILITGIYGYLGSKLATCLSGEFRVCGLDVKDNPEDYPKSIKVYNADHCELIDVLRQENIDTIIHTATLYDYDDKEWRKIARVNLDRSLDLLDAALRSSVKCFINTDTVLGRKVNSYSLSKRQFSEWLQMESSKIKCLNVQLEYFYGPGASKANFIVGMIERLLANESVIPLTDGMQSRDFIHIDDVVKAYQSIVAHLDSFPDHYYDFHIGSQNPLKIKDLVLYLKQITKSDAKLGFGQLSRRLHDDGPCINSTNLVAVPDWEPQICLEEGVKGLIAYAKSQ